MMSNSRNTDFIQMTKESNSLSEITKWTFCFVRIWSENLKNESKKLVRPKAGECRNIAIFGYFKFC